MAHGTTGHRGRSALRSTLDHHEHPKGGQPTPPPAFLRPRPETPAEDDAGPLPSPSPDSSRCRLHERGFTEASKVLKPEPTSKHARAFWYEKSKNSEPDPRSMPWLSAPRTYVARHRHRSGCGWPVSLRPSGTGSSYDVDRQSRRRPEKTAIYKL